MRASRWKRASNSGSAQELGVDELDGHLAFEGDVHGAIDLGHAAAAEDLDQAIAISHEDGQFQSGRRRRPAGRSVRHRDGRGLRKRRAVVGTKPHGCFQLFPASGARRHDHFPSLMFIGRSVFSRIS